MAFGREYEKPIKEGDEIEVTIESTGAKGDGVAKIDNFVVIVPGAKEGQTVRVRITRVLRKMAFGEIVGEGGAEEPKEETSEEATEEEPAEETEEESAEEPTEEETPEEPSEEENTEETPEEEDDSEEA